MVTVAIGRGIIHNVFNQRDQLGAQSIRKLWDLEFANGTLIKTTDQMPLLRRQLEVQRQIIEFAADHNFDAIRSKALFDHCRYLDPGAAIEHPLDSQDQSLYRVLKAIGRKVSGTTTDKYQHFLSWDAVPLFASLQPDAALQTLEYFKRIKGTPLWFIWAYNNSGLSCQLTFNYLRSLTVPAHIVSFLKRLVTSEVTEKMVILEFLESIRQTIAGDYWEVRVLPGHLYTNANIPVDVTAAVRNRLASVTQETGDERIASMTSICFPGTKNLRCALCGATREVPDYPMVYFGTRHDLDGFEEPVYCKAIECCHSCGYASSDLSQMPKNPDVIKSRAYRDILCLRWVDERIKASLCHALIMEAAGEYVAAAWAKIQAARTCNHRIPDQVPHDYFVQALKLIEQAHYQGQLMTMDSGQDALLQAELHRRISEFENALKCIQQAQAEITDEHLLDVLKYELHLIAERNSGDHTTYDAIAIVTKDNRRKKKHDSH